MAGNSDKNPFPRNADQPVQRGQGESTPQSVKAARQTSHKPTGSPGKGDKGGGKHIGTGY